MKITDITLGGVNLSDIKRQRDAMQKDANSFIARTVADAQTIVRQIIKKVEEDENADVDDLATEANELLEAARLVSGITGVQFYLDFNEPYDGGNALSDELEGANLDVYGNGAIGTLYETLQDMEDDSFRWNSSSIGC